MFLDIEVRRVDCRYCGKVKQEKLSFLADNPHYTKRFAMYVGRRCGSSTIKDVAEELHLDWHTVKELDKHYMREQLRRAGTAAPKVIGIDEVSVKKRHVYRIVVSTRRVKRSLMTQPINRCFDIQSTLIRFVIWPEPRFSEFVR